jgi:hypothetical protein
MPVGGAFQGVLPPHPRPLAPCGGEGRFQLSVASLWQIFVWRIRSVARGRARVSAGLLRGGRGGGDLQFQRSLEG